MNFHIFILHVRLVMLSQYFSRNEHVREQCNTADTMESQNFHLYVTVICLIGVRISHRSICRIKMKSLVIKLSLKSICDKIQMSQVSLFHVRNSNDVTPLQDIGGVISQ